MGDRYLALIFADRELRERVRARANVEGGLVVANDDDSLLLLLEPHARALAIDASRWVLGAVFTRGWPTPLAAIPAEPQALIAATRGAYLIDHCWGGYLAFLPGKAEQTVDVVRAPFGELPCLHIDLRPGRALASDVDLLVRFGLYEPDVSWSALARHLAAGDVRTDETCLSGLRELRGGNRLTVSLSSIELQTLWSPCMLSKREKTCCTTSCAFSCDVRRRRMRSSFGRYSR